MPKCKCRACGEVLDTSTAYAVLVNTKRSFYCNEEEYNAYKADKAKGIAIGSASHVIGTSKAMEMGQTEGAMSSLAIVTSGVLTVIAASLISFLQ